MPSLLLHSPVGGCVLGIALVMIVSGSVGTASPSVVVNSELGYFRDGRPIPELAVVDEEIPDWEDYDVQLQRANEAEAKFTQMANHIRGKLHPSISKPDEEKCSTCMTITREVWFLAQDGGPKLKQAELALSLLCYALINNTYAAEVCEDVIVSTLNAFHKDMDSVLKLHFNYSVLMCADILEVCKVPCCETEHVPEQIHLSYPGGDALNATTMQVAWVTATEAKLPLVRSWATADPNSPSTADGETRTYTTSGWVGYIHGAVMTGLRADTNYSYQVGSVNGTWSDVFSFKTLPLNAGSKERPLRIAALADMGVGELHDYTMAQLQNLVQTNQIDFLYHTGDISYADGDTFRWDHYMRSMQSIAAYVPYMVCPGNHEIPYNFTSYKQRFFMPATGYGGPDDAMYYSFSIGKFRFILLDSETPWNTPRMDAVQVGWAQRVMTEANEQKQFIIVGFHRPLYCTFTGGPWKSCDSYDLFFRERIGIPMHNHGVAVLHTGHVHNYERTYSVYNGSVVSHGYNNSDGLLSFVNGAPGCMEGLNGFHHAPHPTWSAHRLSTLGFMQWSLSGEESTVTGGATDFTFKGQFVSSYNMTVLDEVVLTKTI